MPNHLEALEAEVLSLSAEDRSRLLERLITSLDSDPDVDAEWQQEADRRDVEVEGGAVSVVPGPETVAKIRAHLR